MHRQSSPRRTRSRRIAILAGAGFLAALSATAIAQTVHPLDGAWQGELVTEQFRAALTLRIAVDGAKPVIDHRLELDPTRVAEGAATDVRVEGNAVEFSSDVGGASVRYKGAVRGDTLSGSATATRDGQIMGIGTWTAVRKRAP